MIKAILRTIVTAVLRWEAKWVLRKYRPKVVGITGSVGKTGTKDAVAAVLGAHFKIWSSQKSFNHTLGVPLTILGCPNAWWSVRGWLKNMLEGASLILFRAPYPEWLVLEVGLDHPRDIARLAAWVKFDLAIITRLPEIPVHVEFFASAAQVAQEKLELARAVAPGGVVILNHDDPKIMAVKDELKARVMTYGWDVAATVRARAEQVVYQTVGARRLPAGLAFEADYAGQSVTVRLPGILAHHQIYGALAAIAAGLACEMALPEVVAALAKLQTPPGRFNLIEGLKDSLIIDDSYNASPAAVSEALKTLAKIETTGRKIVVLGDMLELGPLTIEAHRQIGSQVAPVADILFTVGLRSKFSADEAQKTVPKKFTQKNHTLFHFDNWRGVGECLQNLIQPGDVILIKGSQSIRLEKVVEEIMAHPEDKEKLLVRQDPEWLKR